MADSYSIYSVKSTLQHNDLFMQKEPIDSISATCNVSACVCYSNVCNGVVVFGCEFTVYVRLRFLVKQT